MLFRLSNTLEIHIPYKNIFKSEKYLLQRLHESISTGHNYIGQSKLSPRMTVVVLAFLFGLIGQPSKNKVYYICQSKTRCKEVKQIAEKLRQYYKTHQSQMSLVPRTTIQELDRQLNQMPSETLILQSFFHKESHLLRDYPNDRYLSILSIKDYFAEIVQQKVNKSSGGHTIKADYMLVETVAYDQIIESCISGWVNEIIIRRAFIQYKKLDAYYHIRDDRKRYLEKTQNNKIKDTINFGDNLIRRNSNSSMEKEHNSHSKDRQNIFHGNHPQKHDKMWNISEIQRKINQSYAMKKQDLLKQKDLKNKNEQNTNIETHRQPSFQQQAIMSLEMVGYLINFFQNYQILTRQSNKMGKEDVMAEECSSMTLIDEIQNKTTLKRDRIKKLDSIIRKLVETFQPLVKPQQYNQNNILFRKGRSTDPYVLSSKHILQMTKFCKDLIQFNDAFNQKYNECIQVSKSCYKEKDRPSFFEIRFRCLNQPLLTEIILEFNQNFMVLMNNGISLQFYSSIFKPKILMKNQGQMVPSSIIQQFSPFQNDKSFKFCFDSPTNVFDNISTNLYGLNVTITPSEQSLKIPEFSIKQDDEHDSLIVKAYGVLLFDLCEVVSDGIVVYFPNKTVINKFRKQWMQKEDIYKKINQIKRIFEYSEFEQQNIANIQQYKKVCDIGRGGVYLIASNSGMAKYTQFQGHYSRCVVFIGIPKTTQVKKKQHLNEKQKEQRKKKENYFNLKQTELQTFYGLKTTAKCLSNCINSHLQPKSVIFADVSYNKQSTKKWFPYIQEGNLNTSQVIEKVKKFHQHSQKLYEQGILLEVGKIFKKKGSNKNDPLYKPK